MSGGHWNDQPADYMSNGNPNYLQGDMRFDPSPDSPSKSQQESMEDRALLRPIPTRMSNDANSLLLGLGAHGGLPSWHGGERASAAPAMSRQPSVPEPGMRGSAFAPTSTHGHGSPQGSAFAPTSTHGHGSPQPDAAQGLPQQWGGYTQGHPAANPGGPLQGPPVMPDALTQLMNGLGANRGMQGSAPSSWPATQGLTPPAYAPLLPGAGGGDYGTAQDYGGENGLQYTQLPGYHTMFPPAAAPSLGGVPGPRDPNLITLDVRALQSLLGPEQLAALAATTPAAQLPQAPPQADTTMYAAALRAFMAQPSPAARMQSYAPPAPVLDNNHALAGIHAILNGLTPAAHLPHQGLGDQAGCGMNMTHAPQTDAAPLGGTAGWPQGVNNLQYPLPSGPGPPNYNGQAQLLSILEHLARQQQILGDPNAWAASNALLHTQGHTPLSNFVGPGGMPYSQDGLTHNGGFVPRDMGMGQGHGLYNHMGPHGGLGGHPARPLARVARQISCSTYCSRLNVTRSMADDLFPPGPTSRPSRVTGSAEPSGTYQLLFKHELNMVDEADYTWRVQYEGFISASQRHCRLTAGWTNFIKLKDVRVGDTVVIERWTEDRFNFKIHVLRGHGAAPTGHGIGMPSNRGRKSGIKRPLEDAAHDDRSVTTSDDEHHASVERRGVKDERDSRMAGPSPVRPKPYGGFSRPPSDDARLGAALNGMALPRTADANGGAQARSSYFHSGTLNENGAISSPSMPHEGAGQGRTMPEQIRPVPHYAGTGSRHIDAIKEEVLRGGIGIMSRFSPQGPGPP